jgi:hypothetical protein
MGQLHHRLAGGDHLPGFGQGCDDSAIGISEQQRISGFVSRDIGLRFSGRQLRFCAVGGRLGLIIPLPRDPTVSGKLAIPRFVGPCLGGQCARRHDGVFLGGQREVEILRIEAHEPLAGVNLLADIDEALDDLARNAKAKIALDARRNYAREYPLGGYGRLRDGNLDELGSLTRIELRRPIRLTADCRCRTEDHRGGAEADGCRQSGGG